MRLSRVAALRAGMHRIRGHLVFAGLLTLFVVSAGSNRAQGAQGYAFGVDGEYVAIETGTFRIVGSGNLWSTFFDSDAQRQEFTAKAGIDPPLLPAVKISRPTTDSPRNRVFFLIGITKLGEDFGYLIARLDTLKYIDVLPRSMSPEDAGILVDPAGALIYVSHGDPGSDTISTVVYDGSTLQLLREYEDSQPYVNTPSCFVSAQSLYANGVLFDTRNEGVIRELPSSLSEKPVSCEKGLLLLVTTPPDGTTNLKVYDIASSQTVRETRTGLVLDAVHDGEWRLSKDARLIIRNETITVFLPDGDRTIRRTGKLVFFDVQSGRQVGTIQLVLDDPDDNGIRGASPDGGLLFFYSGKKLYVVDLIQLALVKEIVLPFRPVGIIWP